LIARYPSGNSVHLDILLPTLNRSVQLRRAARSVLSADCPGNLTVDLYILDNNSTDDTRSVAMELIAEWGERVRYLLVQRPGKSSALNAGIAASGGDLVGFLDDDEEIGSAWLHHVAAAFSHPEVDFIGGRYVPVWPGEPPDWLPPRHTAAVGLVDGGTEPRIFGVNYEGVLVGGNAVIRRPALERAGAFRPALGPRVNKRLLSCEDEDLYLRLLDLGLTGWYLPDLVVLHHVLPERLTKRYHRRWSFWHGVSKAILNRHRPARVRTLAGVPRYMFGDLVRAGARLARPGSRADQFDAELTAWDLAGFLYGRHVYRVNDRSAQDGCGAEDARAERSTHALWQ
jgi:glycosyltransferase involved in cell wall biosynthesis